METYQKKDDTTAIITITKEFEVTLDNVIQTETEKLQRISDIEQSVINENQKLLAIQARKAGLIAAGIRPLSEVEIADFAQQADE